MLHNDLTATNVLEAAHVSVRFGGTHVLKDVSFRLGRGETVAVVGPSGCGKSTLLNVIAGFVPASSGSIHCEECSPPNRVMVMQESLLLPWRSLWKNSLLGAEVSGIERADATAICSALFERLGLSGSEERLPDEASGGMARRVALIRALACRPRLLLADEPFTGLDYDIKLRTQRVLQELQNEWKFATVLVTHDIEDAIISADRVIVLSDKPAVVKDTIAIRFDGAKRQLLSVRTSPEFAGYFARIWRGLKYLGGNE